MALPSKTSDNPGKALAEKVLASGEFEEDVKHIKTTAQLHEYVKSLVGPTLEKILQAELSHHLGYEKYESIGRNLGNSRNGAYPKTINTNSGGINIEVPRDRDSTYEPKIIPKGKITDNEFEDKIISMYAKGMSTRDINEHVADMYGADMSDPMVSMITDKVLPLIIEWQSRPLESLYCFLYLDGIVYKVRDNGKIVNKTVYVVMGIDKQGHKDVLGLWIAGTEGSKFWMSVLTEIKNRGVKDVLFASIDGLSGFSEAIKAVFPDCNIQRCIVHQIRNTLKYIPHKDMKAFAGALKTIYTASTEEAGYEALLQLKEDWPQYAVYLKSWETNWSDLSTFYSYSPEIRRILYTTNPIESLNRQFRKVTKTTTIFPTDQSVLKLLWLAQRDIVKKWTLPIQNWGQILAQLSVLFPEKISL
jgi:putative transposase